MEQFDRLLVCARVLFLDDYGEIFQLITSVVFPFPAVKKKKEAKSAELEKNGHYPPLLSAVICLRSVCREFSARRPQSDGAGGDEEP